MGESDSAMQSLTIIGKALALILFGFQLSIIAATMGGYAILFVGGLLTSFVGVVFAIFE
ncbi:hypothetical protein [Halovivax limisalsi]|uniref:hypothetical protein n=1 Tax=Halovivax limisalsi TaxID=1453760 RepID=UPI001FFC86DC|nr:hypothetical protein [Halovivax limisalsi]